VILKVTKFAYEWEIPDESGAFGGVAASMPGA
jgi:hypothetical protein